MVERKIKIGGKEYAIEAWVREIFDNSQYLIGVQIWGAGGIDLGRIDECTVSQEFVEDNIDNERREEYLENVVSKMAEIHIQDIIKAEGKQPYTRISYWLKQAKREVDDKT